MQCRGNIADYNQTSQHMECFDVVIHIQTENIILIGVFLFCCFMVFLSLFDRVCTSCVFAYFHVLYRVCVSFYSRLNNKILHNAPLN